MTFIDFMFFYSNMYKVNSYFLKEREERMAHTVSEKRTSLKKKRGNKHHGMLVPVAHPESWEEGIVEWHSSSIHANFRYFKDLSWKAATRAPKQWARHKRGVGPLDLKRSLDHWYTPDEDGRVPSIRAGKWAGTDKRGAVAHTARNTSARV